MCIYTNTLLMPNVGMSNEVSCTDSYVHLTKSMKPLNTVVKTIDR